MALFIFPDRISRHYNSWQCAVPLSWKNWQIFLLFLAISYLQVNLSHQRYELQYMHHAVTYIREHCCNSYRNILFVSFKPKLHAFLEEKCLYSYFLRISLCVVHICTIYTQYSTYAWTYTVINTFPLAIHWRCINWLPVPHLTPPPSPSPPPSCPIAETQSHNV